MLWRAFAIGYHDGRTGSDQDGQPRIWRCARPTIRISASAPMAVTCLRPFPRGRASSTFFFGARCRTEAGENLGHSANAAAVEGGYQLTKAPTAPWLRGGWFRSSGDNNATDATHNTFFQILPTPRVYARLPFYNLMNSTDEFVSSWTSRPSGSRSAPTCTGCSSLRRRTCGIWAEALTTIKSSDYVGRPANGAILIGVGSRHQRRLAGDKERCAQFLLCLCPGQDRGCGNLSHRPEYAVRVCWSSCTTGVSIRKGCRPNEHCEIRHDASGKSVDAGDEVSLVAVFPISPSRLLRRSSLRIMASAISRMDLRRCRLSRCMAR